MIVEHTAGTESTITVNDIELSLLVAALNHYLDDRPDTEADYDLAAVMRENLERRDTR